MATALGQLVEVEHFLPEEVHDIPRGRFDLYLQIDDGLECQLPDDLRPSAFRAIDTHLDFRRPLSQAPGADFVVAAQKDGTARLREEGIDAVWLPLACDPELHCAGNEPKRFDVAFVGHVVGGERRRLLDAVRRADAQDAGQRDPRALEIPGAFGNPWDVKHAADWLTPITPRTVRRAS